MVYSIVCRLATIHLLIGTTITSPSPLDTPPVPMTDSAKGVIRAPASASTDGIAIRRVQSADEYDACVRMQHAIWGDDFTEIVPATML